MSINVATTLRGYLISSAVSSQVPAKDILVGYDKDITNFPTIVLYSVGGMDVGYLGYNKATTGSSNRLETTRIAVDIMSRTSLYNCYQIADAVVPVMISGGCRKTNDVEEYNEDLNVYRKILTFKRDTIHKDTI